VVFEARENTEYSFCIEGDPSSPLLVGDLVRPVRTYDGEGDPPVGAFPPFSNISIYCSGGRL